MHVRLKGLNRVTKRLAAGKTVTYHYAWKGGPRLLGKPGSAEFIASYNEAVASRKKAPAGELLRVMQLYQASPDFLDLAASTKREYIRHLRNSIEPEFRDFPISALADRRSRAEFLAWRDRLATKGKRQADYAYSVLARILSWAFNRGLTASNPCERAGRLYKANRAEKVWSDDDEAAFYRSAPSHLHLALTLALWTGQRQGDLLALPWSAYDEAGGVIRLRQGKTGVRVTIPVGEPLRLALAATKRRSPIVLTNSDGHPWTADGFRGSWRKACAKAGVSGVTFHDLRGTAVTRLAKVGATEIEIATLTGHSIRNVKSILDSHYLNRDPALARSAIEKLEKGTKTPN